ncbi:MAG: thiolase family protein [Nitrospirae bacterium]|nr:thiolase family protein [Nitrospirota bacterium]
MAGKVYILDTSMIRFFRYPDRTVRQLAHQATLPLLHRWKLTSEDVDAVVFSNSGWERAEGQTCIRGEVAMRGIGIEGMPIINVENACASGSTAVHVAYHRILAGASDLVLVVGAERISHPNTLLQMSFFLGGLDVGELPRTLEGMKGWMAREGLDKALPPAPAGNGARPHRSGERRSGRLATLRDSLYAALVLRIAYGPALFKALIRAAREGKKSGVGGADRSPFMDVYAMAARYHMQKYGLTQRQLAVVASKNRRHGSLNPLAQVRKPFSVEEVLADRQVSYPLTRAMCAPIGDGAAAALLCSEAYLKKPGVGGPRVRIRASVLVSGTNRGMDEGGDLAVRAGKRAFAEADVGPKDIHVAELHDATAFGEIHHCETLGFCAMGEGGKLAESGATALGGRIPVNTSGGLECRGHPIGASGIAQMHELFEQLTGRAGRRQVEGARIGLTENGGGAIAFEEAALTIHILEREN